MRAEPTRRGLIIGGSATLAGGAAPRARALTVDVAGSPLTLRGEPRFAGAVSSLIYRGAEHVDRSDHGRLFQTAVHFDGWGECLNPTQGGASSDGRRSTSRLLAASVGPDRWATKTRMAYWLRPGQGCDLPGRPGAPAVNIERLSDVEVEVAHRFGALPTANAVAVNVALTTVLPHASAVVEALTIYMPPAFSTLHVWDGARFAAAEPAAERPRPYALATPVGDHAFALFTPAGAQPARFGGFDYGIVRKLNAVFRPAGAFPAGRHAFRLAWAIGTLAEVGAALATAAA